MEFRDILRRRKMVRAYERRPVPAEVLDRVLSVVVHAPSAGFTQGNEFLVLDDPAAVDAFFRITDDPDEPMYAELRDELPPVVVLPLANKRAYLDRYAEPDKAQWGLGDEARWPVPYWDVDAAMASMLILCAAIEEGLGAWFSGIFANEAAMLAHFGVPDAFRPIGFVGLGYPRETDPASATASARRRPRRDASELLHRNGW
ncbi:MAG TPA: nitroreductase family protein [Actinomycetota bacterium]